ncbi:tRNA pseudouridine synthase 1 [Linderina pennispora]|nr:tRNA pseudouridine synthase 1 [Linderina pennispora]
MPETPTAADPVAQPTEAEQPEAQPSADAPEPPKRKNNRAQTCKDRREYAKKVRVDRAAEYEASGAPRQSTSSEPRQPKRKVALLMGFCGTGYQGMQVNHNAKTIEGDLFRALVDAGAVSPDNAGDQKKVQFQRAARTDKGVHAAGQVVSLKMIIEDPEIVSKVNEKLPEQIRVWGYVRVIRSFNAKTMCDSRVYEYLLPTYVFMPPSARNAEVAKTVAYGEREVVESTKEEMEEKRAYRITPEQLEMTRQAFAKYKGTHDFRNFTVTRGCTASNSKRFIMSFTVSDPMVIDGGEWLSLKVQGQSFMLHQIRKMVGLVIMMVRTSTPLTLIDALFDGPRVNVPKAPGLGLLLERPVFDAFSQRVAKQKQEYKDPIVFEPYREEIDAFKQKFIYDNITRTERDEMVFDNWVQNVELSPEQFTYINEEGTIPESAVIMPGADNMGMATKWKGDRAGARNGGESSDEEGDANDG